MGRTLTCAALGSIALSACSSCETNELGKLAATDRGDVSNPPAQRVRFDADLVGACGPSGTTELGAQVFLRTPYVQDVSETEAVIAWTMDDSRPATVAVSTGDAGIEIVTIAAERDRTARLPRGAQFIARLTGLEPGTVYCYQVRLAQAALTRRIGLRTAPARSVPAIARFAAMGDLGLRTVDQAAVLDQLRRVRVDFVVLTGDIAYDDGELAQLERHFFSVYADVLQSVPFFPAAGNHDYDTDGGEPLRQSFVLPDTGGAESGERWYSFDWGPVHVAVLDSTAMGEAQAEWLDGDLGRADRPWNIVALHHPPYSSGHHGGNRAMRRTFVPIFDRHRVDIVVAGHEHNYERTLPVGGVIYVITGGGGRGTRPVGHSSFTAFSQQVAHFTYIEADAQQLRLHAIDGTGVEFDSLVLRKAVR